MLPWSMTARCILSLALFTALTLLAGSSPLRLGARWVHIKGGNIHGNNEEINNVFSDSHSTTKTTNTSTTLTSNISSDTNMYNIPDNNGNNDAASSSFSPQHFQNPSLQDIRVQPQPATELQEASSSLEDQIKYLNATYKHFHSCLLPAYPNCRIYLCGTIHVTQDSVHFVKDAINRLRPDFVMLEICENRIESLCTVEPDDQNITLAGVCKEFWEEKSFKTLGIGLLMWMQTKAAKLLGQRLGGELAVAAREAHKIGSVLILGDRLFGVTIQRAYDCLSLYEKFKVGVMMIWEALTMSLFKIKKYVQKTETDDTFIGDEIAELGKYLPALAEVLIKERDEYMSQTILEISRQMTHLAEHGNSRSVLAVVGAGHIKGIKEFLQRPSHSSEERMQEITVSSAHTESTWPGTGYVQCCDSRWLFPNIPRGSLCDISASYSY